MAKRVLGNDPFQRGAAQRPAATAPAAKPEASEPKKAKKATPAKSAKAPARTKKTAAGRRSKPASTPAETSSPPPEAVPAVTPAAASEVETATEPTRDARPTAPVLAPELIGRPALGSPKSDPVVAERIRRSKPLGDVAGMPRPPTAAVEPPLEVTEPSPFASAIPSGLGARALGIAFELRSQLETALGGERVVRFKDSIAAVVDAALASVGARAPSELDEFGRDPELVRRLRPLLDFLYEEYWRVSVHDGRHVPEGPAILVANHSGALPFDGPMLQQALLRERPELREPRWLVEDQIFYAPFLGTLFSRLGAIRASPENALRLLDQKRPVLVFPEGVQGMGKPFGERYKLKRFGRGGFVKLAMRAGAPIVPVAIVGAEEAVPLLGKLPGKLLGVPYVPVTPLGPVPLPSKWVIRFGEPIAVGGGDPENLSEVQRFADQTRDAIQGMLHTMLRDRRTVFSG